MTPKEAAISVGLMPLSNRKMRLSLNVVMPIRDSEYEGTGRGIRAGLPGLGRLRGICIALVVMGLMLIIEVPIKYWVHLILTD